MKAKTSSAAQLAEQTLSRCQIIAGFSETSSLLTRTFLSQPMHDCHRVVSGWMSDLGMQVSVDAIGNLRGLWGSGDRPRLLIGSHLDTVPCAGAYDGVLGVCLALAVLEAFKDTTLPFDVEVLGFSEEEGVRFRFPFLGSLAAVGRVDSKLLALQDSSGCTVQEAIRQFGLDPARMADAEISRCSFGYLEFHIEQGPVLDRTGQSVAAVAAIAGQSRLSMVFRGSANHAGTTPMDLRRDALAGAAEWVTSVEQYARAVDGLIGTVGSLQVLPGAGNIIPGEVRASLDVRHSCDDTRTSGVQNICHEAEKIASRRNLAFHFEQQVNQKAVLMDEALVSLIERTMERIGEAPYRMVSGAGHDAMIMAEKVSSAMVFIRSIGGISHHPDEAVRPEDVEKAIRLGVAMLTGLTKDFERTT